LIRRHLLRFPRLFVALFEPDDSELGALGEEVAASHYLHNGWRILARRLRTRSGEADLVARRGSILAVVEVKTARAHLLPRPLPRPLARPGGRAHLADLGLRWRPGFRCDAKRLARLQRVARELAASRVDLVEIFLDPGPRRFRLLHHEDLRRPLA
jgi:hypothetical protein